ncbi:MAG: DUF2071 domain-containing protein [Anaerolineae bacterium]|nr:DUF2071 domain-containing protein [Anaerolineae bacterium]
MPPIFRFLDHRPWPLPRSPWIMPQTWHDLLFAHWPVAKEALRPHIPSSLQIDTYDGQAWLGLVPFRMTNVRPRFSPSLPRFSAFPELNVRTYVTDGQKPGVWFFSLDAANRLAVQIARAWYRLPYFHARMECQPDGPGIAYQSARIHPGASSAQFAAAYRPTGPIYFAQPGSLEHWLTERYCLYAPGRRGRVYRGEIHHQPWPLQPAAAEITTNSMAAAATIPLPDIPPLLHFARLIHVAIWPLTPI